MNLTPALEKAQRHYNKGLTWLQGSDAGTNLRVELRAQYAAIATAHFTAGQLALSMAYAERNIAEGEDWDAPEA